MSGGGPVQFYFGPGSRYSYLAATQLARLSAETGAAFRWRVAVSGDLIAAGPADPFAEGRRRGQYASDYRHRDVARWAAHYGVPYVEVSDAPAAWRERALACAAADLMGAGAAFGLALLTACHGDGSPPGAEADYGALAAAAGLDSARFAQVRCSSDAEAAYAANIAEALGAGAFGVPTFVTADGQLFFGQDRLPLLKDWLGR